MRIAVIGSGIAGNSAAWALSGQNEVVLYEKRNRPGGHSATVDIDYDGTPLSVDTGFIVYNELNYPNFTALLDHLGVSTEESDMSFALSADNGRREWAGSSLDTIFAQRKHLFSPTFLRMLRDIFRFNRQCTADRAAGRLSGLSLGTYLDYTGYSQAFVEDYLLAMGAAIWSTPLKEMRDYPAENFVAFFENHRLVHSDRPQWRTIAGGSRNYVNRLISPLRGNFRLGAEVTSIRRQNGQVHVIDSTGNQDIFDHVILASHTDQTLRMLSDASSSEREILSAIRYRPNDVYLHRDERLMPRRKKVWSSWNYMASSDLDQDRNVTVSYWMNRLQNIDRAKPVFVTLNPATPPADHLTFAKLVYDHPQFDAAATLAKAQMSRIQGKQNTWFCGAWAGNGFHEDGIASGLAVARALGAELPWDSRHAEPSFMEAAE